MKKILIVANAILSDSPGVSGGETRFIEIAKQWQKLGYEIHLLGSSGAKKLCTSFDLEVVHHNLPSGVVRGRLSFFGRVFRSMFNLPKSIFEVDFLAVYSTNEMLFDVLPAVRLKIIHGRNIKWGAVVHWLPPFLPWKRKQSTLINSIFFFLNERLSLLAANIFADVLLPVSQSTKDQMKAVRWVNMQKVSHVNCGVDYELIRSIASKKPKKIYEAIFMKRLQAVKGIFDIIDIWKLIVKKNPSAILVVVGEGIDSEKARTKVSSLGLDKNVIFMGVITDPNIKFKLIAQSKIFVLPTYEENWAIVIGESLTCGTPVLTYDLPELRRVWNNKINYVPVGDISRFVREIELTQSQGESSKNQRNALWMKKYSWEKIAQNEISLIMNS